MTEVLDALYELQIIDKKIDKNKQLLESLSGGLELKKKQAIAKRMLETSTKNLLKNETDLKDSELQLKSIEEKLASSEKRLYGGKISSPKELSAVEKEISNLKNQQGEMDVKVLELIDQVADDKEKKNNAVKLTSVIEKRLKETLLQEENEKNRLESELIALEKTRPEIIVKITDRPLLAKYDSIRKRTKSTAVAKVIDGQCSGCHVTIAVFTINNLRTQPEYQTCESCGRILHMDT